MCMCVWTDVAYLLQVGKYDLEMCQRACLLSFISGFISEMGCQQKCHFYHVSGDGKILLFGYSTQRAQAALLVLVSSLALCFTCHHWQE